MFIYETHTHTNIGSACAVSAPEEMVRSYKEQGYAGICVTDHFFNGNTAIPKDLPWKKRIEMYCVGYERAKAEGDKIGLTVFFGFEYNYHGTEFITVGVGKDWLIEHPEIESGITLSDYIKLVHDSGGMVIHVHPFRDEWYIEMHRLIPHLTDCVEVYNTGNHQDVYNERALWYAKSFGFPITAGSDSHNAADRMVAGIATESPITTTEQYMSVLKDGACRLYWRGEFLEQNNL